MKLEIILQKKLLPPTLFIICSLLAIIFSFIISMHFIDYSYNWIGFIFLIVGLFISKRGSDHFQKAETNINTFDEPDKLITSGMFKYSRNPMYLGFVIALSGISVILGTIPAIVILIMYILITDQWYIKFEEKMMIKKFGDRYVEYMKTTRRWI